MGRWPLLSLAAGKADIVVTGQKPSLTLPGNIDISGAVRRDHVPVTTLIIQLF
jgi:hypothetical protein